MLWIRQFQLFLFDFDGVLVNTEELQFQAYVDAMAKRGYQLAWQFDRFCEVAHLNSAALKEAICIEFPQLLPQWETFYEEKKRSYLDLIRRGRIELMPGVERLLKELAVAGIRRCVVTNAPSAQTDLICAQLPILRTLPCWVTREQYQQPKPHPEAYLRAIELYGRPNDRIIGFEDTIRGLQALVQTPATACLICSKVHPLLQMNAMYGARHFESFEELLCTFTQEF